MHLTYTLKRGHFNVSATTTRLYLHLHRASSDEPQWSFVAHCPWYGEDWQRPFRSCSNALPYVFLNGLSLRRCNSNTMFVANIVFSFDCYIQSCA